MVFDAFNLKAYLLWRMPRDLMVLTLEFGKDLLPLCDMLMENFKSNSSFIERGPSMSYTVYPRLAKAILDEIDSVLARHYCFSDDELTFILNYDLKFRLGTYSSTGNQESS